MAENTKEQEYKRTILFHSDEFEIVSIEWSKGSGSEIHNHGLSQCMVQIQEGLFENTLDLGFKTEVRIFETGQVVTTPKGARHKMRCLSPQGKTLHVYTPKIVEQSEAGKFKSQLTENFKNELKLSEPLALEGLREVLSQIQSKSVSTNSAFFMNQLFSGVLPQMLLAEELIVQTRTTLATSEASPIFSSIEEEVISSLGALIGWSENERFGVSVPGGSSANFMAVHCARQRLLPQVKNEGLNSAKLRVYVSCEAHYSMKKACLVLGLGLNNLVQIASDDAGRMKLDHLGNAINTDLKNGFTPLMVCATAGTTVYGAFDPIDEISKLCEMRNIWLHVDAAWGGPALFSKSLNPLVKGIEKADSVTFDAHKLFGANLTCSFFLTSHEQILFEANDVSGGDYIFHEENFDRGRLSWQCGRRAEATSFWTIWKSVGTAGLGEFVERLIQIRNETLDFIATQPRLQLVGKPEFLNICVRVLDPSGKDSNWSKKIRARLIESDQAMVNYAANSEGPFLRLILAHPYLQTQHVQNILTAALNFD